MAAKSYEAGVRKYYGDRLTNISDDTTIEEIRHVYDNWASEYDKVTIISSDSVYMGPDKFLNGQKLAWTRLSITPNPRNRASLSRTANNTAICNRICTVLHCVNGFAQAKKFVRLKIFPDTSKQGQFRSQVKLRLMVFILNSASPRVKRVATEVSKFSARSLRSLKNSKFSFSLLQSPCKYT